MGDYDYSSMTSAAGEFFFTDAMPFSIPEEDSYISLVPMISPLPALRCVLTKITCCLQLADHVAWRLHLYTIKDMEKRLLGIILSILGIAGLILAGVHFMNGGTGMKNIKGIILYGILGAIFFFAGIGLVRNTRDKAT